MPLFQYKAINSEGTVVRSALEAPDLDAAYDTAGSAGLHILSISAQNPWLAAVSRKFNARKVKRRELIEFANNISVMLRAGFPILTALTDIADTTDNRYFLGKIENIRHNVSMGSSFSDAVRMNDDIFPDMFIRLVSVGEQTGNLEGSLTDIAHHLQNIEKLVAAIKSALIYPVFALVTTTGAMVFWLVYVLPQILTVFKDMNIKTPAVTQFLIVLSNFMQDYWPILILLPIVVFLVAKFLRRYDQPEYYLDLLKIRLPILKLIMVNKALGLFAEQMRILIRAGLTIDRSFDITAEVVNNRVYGDAILEIKEDVIAGASISDAMKAKALFPAMLLRMVHIGESSGTLEDQFAFLSDFYLKKLDEISERLGKMLEPIMIVVLGGMFALIIIGLLLPIYDLVTASGAI